MATTKLDIAKTAVHYITGAGVGKVVHDIIANNTEPEDFAEKAQIVVGSAVIGSMVAERTAAHVEAKMDAVAAWYTNRRTKTPTE